MKSKKYLLIAGILLIFVVITLTWLFGWGMGEKGDDQLNSILPTPATTAVDLPEDKEPTIKLDISSDRSGAVLLVGKIDKQFSQLEYELVYLAESDDQEIERQIAGGPLEISSSREVREELLFGSESCTTGTCRRHIDKNVSGGTLVVRLITAENQTWSLEKEFAIEKSSKGYEAVWKKTESVN